MWRRAELALSIGTAVALATSCKVGPNFHRPPKPRVDGYTSGKAPARAGQQQFYLSAEVAHDWWRLWRSPALNALVREALTNNASLQAGIAALRASQEARLAGHGVFYPQVQLDASAGRQRFNPSQFGISGPTGAPQAQPQPPGGSVGTGNVFNLFSLGASVSYALDVWGGNRRTVEVLGARVDEQRYTLLGTYLMLTSNVVTTAIAAAGYREQLRVTRLLVKRQKDQVSITNAQYQAGLTSYTGLVAQQAQVAATQATIPALQLRLKQAEHLLARLVGKLPAHWAPPKLRLADLTLPQRIPLGVPTRLVRRRPDVLRAEARLHASTAQIGVATAAMLPNFTLSGSFGLNSNTASRLFDWSSRLWSIAGGLTAPLFEGGRRWHERKQAIYARQAALAEYQQAVLEAFEEVANALRALEYGAAIYAAQRDAVAYARTRSRLARANLEAGTVDYLELLAADTQYLQAQLEYVQAVTQRLQDTALLFVALGGGWWNAPRREASDFRRQTAGGTQSR